MTADPPWPRSSSVSKKFAARLLAYKFEMFSIFVVDNFSGLAEIECEIESN
jgi:hypothetical protein